MSLHAKYLSVLKLGEQLNARDGSVQEYDGVLRFYCTVETVHQQDRLWDAIKDAGGKNPSDIVAHIQVANPDVYAFHTVKKGESLPLISKHYYGDLMKYKHIFEANRAQLTDADHIEVGQQLVIPNP